jgi:cytochrome c5
MILEGIKWAMGVTKADVTPKPFPGKPASAQPQQPAVQQPAAKQSPPQASAQEGAGLPDGPGKTALVAVCGECHSVEQAVSMRASEQDWKDTIALMVDRGASGSEEDFRSILAYLTKNFGPKQ